MFRMSGFWINIRPLSFTSVKEEETFISFSWCCCCCWCWWWCDGAGLTSLSQLSISSLSKIDGDHLDEAEGQVERLGIGEEGSQGMWEKMKKVGLSCFRTFTPPAFYFIQFCVWQRHFHICGWEERQRSIKTSESKWFVFFFLIWK